MRRKRSIFFPASMLSLGAFAAGVVFSEFRNRDPDLRLSRQPEATKLEEALRAADRLDAGKALAAILPALTEGETDADPRISKLMWRASLRLKSQEARIAALIERLEDGYAQRRIVEIERPQVAYPLLPPKLMISVQALTGGSLITHFSDRTQIVAVGKRVDLVADGLPCFLILLESNRQGARFDFGCEEPVRKASHSPPL
ncbi:MAG: hypothetical protein AAF415_20980 [Pseudomonadota bacterium]